MEEKTLSLTQRMGEDLANLLGVSVNMVQRTELASLLKFIMDEAARILDAERCTLYLVDEGTRELRSFIAQRAEVKEIRLPLGKGIAGHVAKTAEVVNLEDAYQSPLFDPKTDKETGYRTRSVLCIPMKDKNNKMIGALQALNKKKGAFNSHDEWLFKSYAACAANSVSAITVGEKAAPDAKFRENLERLSLTVENMPDGVIMLLREEDCVVVNPAARWMLGLEINKIVDKKGAEECLKEIGLGNVLKWLEGEVEKLSSQEITLQGPKERVLKADFAGINGDAGLKEGIVIVLRDITKEKEMERIKLFSIVERAKKEWEQTFDSIEDMVMVLDKDLRIARANKATLRYTGLDFHEIMGRAHHEVFPFCKGPGCPVIECHRSLKPVDIEMEDDKTGNAFLACAFLFLGPRGESQGIVNIMRNITEQKRASRELEARRITAMVKLAELAEKRDHTTGTHLMRVGEYCHILCQELRKLAKYKERISDAFISSIKESSLLHDVGKVAIPDLILLKKGRLTKEEFGVMKVHTTVGEETLTGPEYFAIAREICRFHHERYEGSGYPDGLKGDAIPLSAQIVGLVDVYDALTSKRPYREALSHEEASKIIQDESGKHFNPDIVQAFINGQEDFDLVRKRYSDQA